MECVKHLVLSGGGFKGIAFCGVLECLQRRNGLKLNRLTSLAGSSAGSTVCLLLAIGYTNAEIYKHVHELDFASLLNPKFELLLSQYGIETGDAFVRMFQDLLRRKNVPVDITLGELFKMTGKRLVITVSCLGKGVRYLDHKSEPDLSAVTAVRMSIAIPFLVTPVFYKGDYYVDGGLLDNAPIALFASEKAHEVLTVRVDMVTPSSNTISDDEVNNIEDYFRLLFMTVVKEMNDLRLKRAKKLDKTAINVACGNHRIIITNDYKKHLFRLGYEAAKNYLASDTYLSLQVESLPHEATQRIWKHNHNTFFAAVLRDINRVDE